MHQAGSETRQNPIRAKNLVSEAANRMSQLGCSQDQIERVLSPAAQLGDSPDNEFWRHQAQSLSMLLAPEFARFLRLPYETTELVVVGERFNLKPLLRLLTGDGPFHILALSQQQVRLFQATRYQVESTEVDDLPASMDEALAVDDVQDSLQYRAYTSMGVGAAGDARALRHGHGGTSDIQEDFIERFCQQVDRAVCAHLGHQGGPLVIAAETSLFGEFKRITKYPDLIAEPLAGNPDNTSDKELHEAAWQLVESRMNQDRTQAIEEYGVAQGQGLASRDLAEILFAARDGRVQQLLLNRGACKWGRFDEASGQLERHSEPRAGSEDLLDYAAVRTLEQGGEVFQLEADLMPVNELALATFRYPVTSRS